MNIDDFEKLIKVFFGFGNNHSIKRWIKNFEEVDFISINRVDDKWIVKINIGGISDEVE